MCYWPLKFLPVNRLERDILLLKRAGREVHQGTLTHSSNKCPTLRGRVTACPVIESFNSVLNIAVPEACAALCLIHDAVGLR
jgi:hypothetical protein